MWESQEKSAGVPLLNSNDTARRQRENFEHIRNTTLSQNIICRDSLDVSVFEEELKNIQPGFANRVGERS